MTWAADLAVSGQPLSLQNIPTPALVLDLPVLERNCERMRRLATAHGVELRPHLKTAKSAEVARIATLGQPGGITVSTVAEAAYFAARGFVDLTYAVGIAPDKLASLDALQREHHADIRLIADHPSQVSAVAARASALGGAFEVLIEVDTGGGRGGIPPEGPELLELAGLLASAAPTLRLVGVLTHAGHSYHAHGAAEITKVAEAERAGAVLAASRLRAAGHVCRVVSVGSTPTVLHAERFDGVTEIRPGVYTLFDLHQAALGCCGIRDIAASVLATVIGHNERVGRIVLDAGGLALSKDVSANELRTDAGYGLICPAISDCSPVPEHYVIEVHQEHGLVAGPRGGPPDWERMPVGSRVRVLPNHACMTAAPYRRFHVVDGESGIVQVWDRATGW